MSAVAAIQGGSAVFYAALCSLILIRGRASATGLMLALSCAATALATAAAALSTLLPPGWPDSLDLLQSLAWYGFVLHVFRATVPRGPAGLQRIFITIGVVALALTALAIGTNRGEGEGFSLFSAAIAARLGLAVGRLLLIENLYANTPQRQRWHVALPCIGLGGLALFDIVRCADIILQHHVSPALEASRAVATALVAPVMAVAAARISSWAVDFRLSRTAAFHSATLVVSGIFLLALAALGEASRRITADWASLIEISLVFAGLLLIGLLLTSHRMRLRFRRLAVDHFFSARFDYRHEWLRCIETLSSTDNDTTLPARVIRSAAEAVNSQAGTLFLREVGGAAFEWAGDLNLQSGRAPVLADHPLITAFRDGAWTVEAGSGPAFPPVPGAWLALPLAQRASLIGFIVVARPQVPFRLDPEVFDLLRMIAREVASFIAEHQAMRIITQTRELHDYSKRFAFVAHDIKNVSSQLSLLLANAETHIANPAFQQDMLGTVRASVARIGSLLRRLQAPATDQNGATARPVARLEAILADYRRRRGRSFTLDADGEDAVVAMNADAFDTVVTHLLNNAVEASDAAATVRVSVRNDAARVHVEIADNGAGMSPEFIRDELFSPFHTSKQEGSGIGAFQARELLRAAGGDLLVDSTPGAGTTMRLLLNRTTVRAQVLASA